MKSAIKSKLQGFAAGLVVCSILMFNSVVFSSDLEKTISVVFNAVKVKIDGKELTGNNIYYNDHVYVRLDKVSELLGKTLNWDKNGSIVDMADKAQAGATLLPIEVNGDAEQKIEEIVVGNVDEFIKAIGPNRKIILKPGVYNLSQVQERQEENKNISWAKVSDGVELQVNNVNNLTICGEGNVPAEIVAEPRFAEIISFRGCRNITLSNLKIGHTVIEDDYDCNAGVLHIDYSNNICIDNCILYGCGSVGITAYHSSLLKMNNSVIEKCNLRVMSLNGCEDFTFTDCKFRECTHQEMFNLAFTDNIIFNGCEIKDNICIYGTLFYLYEASNTKVLNSKIINNIADGAGEGLDFTGTTFEGNIFSEE